MNNEITREQRAFSWLIVFSIVMVAVGFLIMALSSAGVLGYTPQPVSDPVEPDPWILGNVTKDVHESSWSLVHYEDDYGDVRTLPGFTANTIYLNYSAFDGHQTYDIGGANWSDPDDWTIGSCDMSSPSVSQTQTGISFYADPTAASQGCAWTLDIAPFEVSDEKDKWTVGAYFEKLGGFGQITRFRIEEPDNSPKEYEGYCKDTVPGEGGSSMYVANENRTAIFESEVIRQIGSLNEEFAEVDELYVIFTANDASGLDPMEVELFFMAFSPEIMRVGYSLTGDQVYRQTQADQNEVQLGTFSPTFDYTQVKNLKLNYKQYASDLPDAYVEIYRSQYLSTYRFSYPQPEATSLSYDDIVLRDKLNQAGNVFSEVKLNGQEITYRYEPLSEGDEIVLLDGIQEGEQPALYYETSYSSDEWDGITEGGGGWWSFGGITPQLMAPFVALGILVAILAVVLVQRWKKSREERPTGEEKSPRGLATDDNAFIMILMEGREIVNWVIIGGIVVFIVFTIIAMIRDIPIIWPGWIAAGSLIALSWGGYSTWNSEGLAEGLGGAVGGFQLDFMSDIMDTFVQGFKSIFDAIIGAFVLVINTIGSVIAAFIELIILPPARFTASAFDTAADALTHLGISAPLAMIIVVVSVGLVIALVGVFVWRQLTSWED